MEGEGVEFVSSQGFLGNEKVLEPVIKDQLKTGETSVHISVTLSSKTLQAAGSFTLVLWFCR